jgi:hypothetical protein
LLCKFAPFLAKTFNCRRVKVGCLRSHSFTSVFLAFWIRMRRSFSASPEILAHVPIFKARQATQVF